MTADERELRRRLNAAVRARRYFPRGSMPGDLEPLALQVLLSLWLDDAATVGELAERLAARSQSISNAVAELRRRRLVSEEIGLDRRERLQRITHLGRATVDRYMTESG